MSDAQPTKPSTLSNLAKADPIAAAVSLIVFVLSTAKIPERLGLTADATVGIGAAVVAVAGAVRGYLRYRKGEEVALQDLFAAAIGLIFGALSLAGVPNMMEMDPNTIAMLASALVTILTVRRSVKPAA